jgi:hypothetical protein
MNEQYFVLLLVHMERYALPASQALKTDTEPRRAELRVRFDVMGADRITFIGTEDQRL